MKQIVFYVDDAFPELWKEPIRQAVTTWNAAFEKIGFKNVMVAKDFPKDDPDFDPDNLKYSCIRYVANSTANAMDPLGQTRRRVRLLMPPCWFTVISSS